MAGDTPVPRFNVALPPAQRDQLKKWAEQAARLGRRADFLDALRGMTERLELIPDDWGDPLFGYVHINAEEYRGMISGWWFVWYGVDVDARQVFVRRLLPAPGSPLTAE